MLTVLDLFSGIGGMSLGLEMTGGFRTIQFVEIDRYGRQGLAHNFFGVPIHDDIKTFDAAGFAGADVIIGGPPCQPFSVAGQRRGAADDRNLWPEMYRVIAAVKPRWAIVENVRGFVSEPMGLDQCLSDLAEAGYTSQSFVLPAIGIDAPHIRARTFVIAYNSDAASRRSQRCDEPGIGEGGNRQDRVRDQSAGTSTHDGQPVADAGLCRLPEWRRLRSRRQEADAPASTHYRWPAEPNVDRVAYGVPNRVHRIKGLGNAVVPALIAEIGAAILEAEA